MRIPYPMYLFGLFVPIWILAAIGPLTRVGWLLENLLVFVAIPFLIWTYYRFRLSNLSYTLIFLFLVLHTIGGHYTYAEVPLGYWLMQAFDLSRNHYDRIVHFAFGFLLAYPIREFFLRVASTRGFWGYYFPFELTVAFSGIYEMIEWLIVLIVAPDAGIAYLGAQGDIWDAQKDMALAGFGAFLAMSFMMWLDWHEDLRKEFLRSWTIKRKAPLRWKMGR